MKIQKNSRLVMIGDSITDVSRVRPVGNPRGEGLGKGYVNLVNSMLLTAYPQLEIGVFNTGCSGNRIIDLEERWQSDVLDLKPDWLSVMIGINDVWRHFDSPHSDIQVSIEKYEQVLDELLAKTKPILSGGLILMSPYFIEPNKQEPMRQMMDAYGLIVKKMAQKYDAIFIDIQAVFDEATKYHNPTFIAWDRIHPATHGHMLIARAFLNAIDFDFKN